MSVRWPPPPFSWPGIIGLVLALSLGLGWSVTLVIATLPSSPEPTPEGLELLNGIGQVLAGAVATYLGSSIMAQRDTRQETAVRPIDAGNPGSGIEPLPGANSAGRGAPGTTDSPPRR